MNELVSVIIPAYNSELYIEDCIASVLEQTYQEVEIIVVDDGSKDQTLKILQGMSEMHSNLIVLTQENHGIAYTRNRAIRHASGTYLMFMDNDDTMKKDCIEIFVRLIQEKNADMIVGGYQRVTPEGKILEEMVLTDDEWSKYRMISPWARIMRADFVREHHLEFGDFKMGEDSYFNITAYNESNRIYTTPYVGYHWIYREQSVSNTTQKKAVHSPIPFLEALMKRNASPQYTKREMFEYFVIKYIVWHLTFICPQSTKQELSEAYSRYFSWLKEKIPDYKKNPYVGLSTPKGERAKIRMIVTIFCRMPKSVTMFFMQIYKRIAM